MEPDSINKIWRYRILPSLDNDDADKLFEAEKLLRFLEPERKVVFVYRWLTEDDGEVINERTFDVTSYDYETMILTVDQNFRFRFTSEGLFSFQSGPEDLSGEAADYFIS